RRVGPLDPAAVGPHGRDCPRDHRALQLPDRDDHQHHHPDLPVPARNQSGVWPGPTADDGPWLLPAPRAAVPVPVPAAAPAAVGAASDSTSADPARRTPADAGPVLVPELRPARRT